MPDWLAERYYNDKGSCGPNAIAYVSDVFLGKVPDKETLYQELNFSPNTGNGTSEKKIRQWLRKNNLEFETVKGFPENLRNDEILMVFTKNRDIVHTDIAVRKVTKPSRGFITIYGEFWAFAHSGFMIIRKASSTKKIFSVKKIH